MNAKADLKIVGSFLHRMQQMRHVSVYVTVYAETNHHLVNLYIWACIVKRGYNSEFWFLR